MPTVQLIHWKPEEAPERVARLEALGYRVRYALPHGLAFVRELAAEPPDAVVIDLARLPSQGRDFGLLIRGRAGTRHVPLAFVGGDPAKVAALRELLPDVAYTTWEELGPALAEAIAHPPTHPVTPASSFEAYRGRALPDKLGIREGARVALVDAPDDFEETLGELPSGATLKRWADLVVGAPREEGSDLAIWFVRSQTDVARGLPAALELAARGPLWIAWPKRSSGVASDLTQPAVRQAGLDAGLVDYKICSIDQVWSGLLFTLREPV